VKHISRTAARALAQPLADAARRHFDAPAVHAAADAVTLAVLQLEDELTGARGAQGGLSAEAAELRALEQRLDQRVRAAAAVLDGLATLGDAQAEAVLDAAFPMPAHQLTRPGGRSQAPEYGQIAAALRAFDPAELPASLQAVLPALADDLSDFVDRVLAKDGLRDAASTRVGSLQATTDALRAALSDLAWQVRGVTGGPTTPAYKAWIRLGGGLI
jgi:hypothetical protein